ncbi:CBO0543 family protein [Bacillus sp. USDA818B3_A]|uniref:CBO0543 family protein n=1 Tax=Bacillus sp. USDA818B3_A TaxID=2698834 RepID=UPI003FA44A3C
MLLLRTALCLILLLCCWKWGDFKNWEKYYPTILYMIVNQLLYNFFVDGHYFLWKMESENFLLDRTFSVLVAAFIIFPCIIILFLSHLPKSMRKQMGYIILWGFILCNIEGVMYLTENITYHHGWNYWWSIAFNFLMVSMLRFHYSKPISAWIVSFVFTAFFVIYFHVPLPEH